MGYDSTLTTLPSGVMMSDFAEKPRKVSALLPVLSGKLKVKTKLGEGSCAIVYKGLKDTQKVALKVYRPQCQDLAYHEGQLLHQYQHKHIVQLFGLVENITGGANAGPALIMDYCDGGSLFRMISKQMANPHSRLYSDDDALTWLLQIASALEFLHEQSPVVVHRDLKQENIMLKKQDGRTVAKLLDFSLTTELSDSKLNLDASFLLFPRPPLNPIVSSTATSDTAAPLDSRSSLNTTSTPALTASSFPLSTAPSSTLSDIAPSSDAPAPTADTLLGSNSVPLLRTESAEAPAKYVEWWKKPADDIKGHDNFVARANSSRHSFAMTTASSTCSCYNLTGMTGSFAYMPPEVFKNEPYNETVDVFSFGVVMYELFARTLLVYTQASNGTEVEMHRYAAKVAGGFRPPESKKIPAPVWALVQQCWEQDPELRPSMQHVAEMLQGLILSGQAQRKPQKQQKQQAPAEEGALPAGPTASDGASRKVAKGNKLADSKCSVM